MPHSQSILCSIVEMYCRLSWQGLLVLEMLTVQAEKQDVQDYSILSNQGSNWIQSLRPFREGISWNVSPKLSEDVTKEAKDMTEETSCDFWIRKALSPMFMSCCKCQMLPCARSACFRLWRAVHTLAPALSVKVSLCRGNLGWSYRKPFQVLFWPEGERDNTLWKHASFLPSFLQWVITGKAPLCSTLLL